jgi:hypothetical protein
MPTRDRRERALRAEQKNFQNRLSSICDFCLESKAASFAVLFVMVTSSEGCAVLMLHFSCDLCGQPLEDRRYVVRLEIFPAFDPEDLSEADLDADHLQEVAEEIHEMEITGAELEDVNSKSFRFDLCPRCHGKYLKDPLGRDALRRLNFSEN